jgi:hypothetical protein
MLKLGTAALAVGAVLTGGAGQAASAAPGPKSARPRFAPDPVRPMPTVTFKDQYTLTVGDQQLEFSSEVR